MNLQYDVVHGHICKLCKYYKNYTIIWAFRCTIECYFSTCEHRTNPW